MACYFLAVFPEGDQQEECAKQSLICKSNLDKGFSPAPGTAAFFRYGLPRVESTNCGVLCGKARIIARVHSALNEKIDCQHTE